MGVYLGVSQASRPIPKRAEFQNSPIFGVLLYLCLCLHPLTQNDQSHHGNTYGEWRVLACQTRHCICTNASRVCQRQLSFLLAIVTIAEYFRPLLPLSVVALWLSYLFIRCFCINTTTLQH